MIAVYVLESWQSEQLIECYRREGNYKGFDVALEEQLCPVVRQHADQSGGLCRSYNFLVDVLDLNRAAKFEIQPGQRPRHHGLNKSR